MAIINCPNCARRISSRAPACPYCETPTGEMTEEERHRMAFRRWRGRLHRARNLTYIAMGIVIGGALWWWFAPPEGLMLPAPMMAWVLMGGGLAVYLVGWVMIVWLKLPGQRPRPGR